MPKKTERTTVGGPVDVKVTKVWFKINFNEKWQHHEYLAVVLEDAKGNKLLNADTKKKGGNWVAHVIHDNEWLVGFHGAILEVPDNAGYRWRNEAESTDSSKIIRLGIVTGKRPPTKRSIRRGIHNVKPEDADKKGCTLF